MTFDQRRDPLLSYDTKAASPSPKDGPPVASGPATFAETMSWPDSLIAMSLAVSSPGRPERGRPGHAPIGVIQLGHEDVEPAKAADRIGTEHSGARNCAGDVDVAGRTDRSAGATTSSISAVPLTSCSAARCSADAAAPFRRMSGEKRFRRRRDRGGPPIHISAT